MEMKVTLTTSHTFDKMGQRDVKFYPEIVGRPKQEQVGRISLSHYNVELRRHTATFFRGSFNEVLMM